MESMQKPTPDESADLINQLETAEQESNDPVEKDRLEQLSSQFRTAIVADFVKRPQETDEADSKDRM
jgi:hypothetical protein